MKGDSMEAMTATGQADTDINRKARSAAIDAGYRNLLASGRSPTLEEREALIMAAYEKHPYETTGGSDAVRRVLAARTTEIHRARSRQQALHDHVLAGVARIDDPVMRAGVLQTL